MKILIILFIIINSGLLIAQNWITVETDTTHYQIGQDIEIYVIAHNYTNEPIILQWPNSYNVFGYFIDNYHATNWGFAFPLIITIPPDSSHIFHITHYVYEYQPQPGNHTVIGEIVNYGYSDPITIIILPEASNDNECIEHNYFVLYQNSPNPFNPKTTISFSVTQNAMSSSDGSSFVTLDIYNIKGQKVKTLINEKLPAGNHQVVWNGKDENSKSVSSGIYFYKLQSGKFEETKKMILLK